jgi:5-methylcytosine-specific restriction endonuclease McrA
MCSEACAQERRRIREYSRQAVKRGATSVVHVVPREIFDRDQWRCHICRRKLSADVTWPHPRSASVDHLVPLSKGGEHSPENVETACLQCNISKGNRGGNEQLLLIG